MRESAAHWNELHANPRFRPAYPSEHAVRFLLSAPLSPPHRPPRFLDIGTGAGRHMTLAADLGFFPVGTDVSQNGLLHARERLVSHNVPHAVVAAGMSYLPFADCSFSVVLSYGVVYYGTSSVMKRAIREAWRVMRPSGRMLVVLRSARDYRYGKGEQLERNTYRLEISDTNELGTTLHFQSTSPILLTSASKVPSSPLEIAAS